MTINHIAIGAFQIFGLRDGFFYLDGGAMFGVVPKVLWNKKAPADSKNRIKLGLNSILIDTGEALVLVDTGMGTGIEEKFYALYSVENKPGLLSSLQERGHTSDKIDFVINTHLHFDHCGGNTRRSSTGEWIPVFSQAEYIIQEREWDYALHPSERDKESYLTQNFLPLEKYGLLKLIHGRSEVCKGVEVFPTGGHTSHHQCVKVVSEGKILLFLGDLVPTAAHIGLPYVMSFDLFPLETMKKKKEIFDQAIEENWIFAFNHDPHHFFGRVKKIKGKYHFQPM